MSDTPTPQRRWLMPVLLLSVAANLLVVGIVAGWMITSGGERPDRTSREVSQLVGPQFFRALPPKDRRALVKDIAGQRDRVRENRGALKRRIENLLTVIVADPFDIDAARALLAEQRASVADRHAFGEELLLTRLQAMTLEEREAFAARLTDALGRVRRD